MVRGLLRAVVRIRVTVVYAAVLTAVTTALTTLEPSVQDRIIRHASTNLHNLSHGHIGTLLASAIVIDAGPIYLWLPGLFCLLAIAELMWRSRRLVVAFVVGHIGATLLVAVGLTAAVELSWLSTDVTRATDVGMSYGASAVLGSLTSAVPRRWRPAWAGWWLAVALTVVGLGGDFTAVGHATALMLGMAVATRFGAADRWTPLRWLLLGAGTCFGFLMLAGGGSTLVLATAVGLIGAALGELLFGRRRARESTPEPTGAPCAVSPGVA
jgi:hypothetical protein